MEIQKTTGIVLVSKPMGEADILSTVYTREYGKRKFIFKGLRKSKKRSHTAAEPGSVTVLQFYYHEGKETSIVNDFTIKKHYWEIRKNLQKIYHLCFMLEVIDKTTGLNDTDAPFYDLLAAGIDTLAATDYPVNLGAFFLMHILRLHGILIPSSRCSRCGSDNFVNFSLSSSDLSPLCANCSTGNHMLSLSARRFMQDVLSIKFMSMNHGGYETRDLLDLIFYLVMFIESYFHVRIKSKEFILSEQLV